MRILTAGLKHQEVYDLQGRDCKKEKNIMHDKLFEQGIDILDFIVQKVTLPPDSEHRMQEETVSAVNQRVNNVTTNEQKVTEKNADEIAMLQKKATINQNNAE